ncbi:hypothetical protein [Pseudomonas aeruginosa]|uniref:hypothetical protein n=1 Tax=Pseudomonas aeruginosa TaxID=287 RepID=UPI001C01AF52|nr:hypothetical protein [Pseudomonas aeruginosa]MBT9308338.1 hypothetical protein [Pseudomonas aeruginosa]HBO6122863.1 hypothetical protein [Pseudomonas aeruginosa]
MHFFLTASRWANAGLGTPLPNGCLGSLYADGQQMQLHKFRPWFAQVSLHETGAAAFQNHASRKRRFWHRRCTP